MQKKKKSLVCEILKKKFKIIVILVKFHRPPPITPLKVCEAQRLGFLKIFFLTSGMSTPESKS
jgi:hypothetical protein